MCEFDLILGMDWLTEHHATIDCHSYRVIFGDIHAPEYTYHGSLPGKSMQIISALQARTLLYHGCEDELPGIPLVREVAQDLEIIKLKTRVKKLERTNKVKTLKLRRLRKVGTTQRVDTSDDTLIEDVSNQGRIIDELDKDEGVVLMNEKEETEEVFANMRRVGKGCSRVETPLFKCMLVAIEPEEQGDAEEQGNTDNAAKEPITAASEDDVEDQSIPSPTPPTPPPQQPQDIPSTSQAQSPPPQP
nr:reverse transcriptase domain-containing protein [Tanacetum cinerariifolium]